MPTAACLTDYRHLVGAILGQGPDTYVDDGGLSIRPDRGYPFFYLWEGGGAREDRVGKPGRSVKN